MKNKTGSAVRIILIIMLIVAVVLLFAMLFTDNNKDKEIAYTGEGSLFEKIESGLIKELYIVGGYEVRALTSDTKIESKQFPKKYDYIAYIDSRNVFMGHLGELEAKMAGVEGFKMPKVRFDNPSNNSNWTSMIFPAVGMISIGLLLFFMYRQSAGANGKAMSFGKTKARLNTNVKVRFTDVAGAEEEKEELAEIVEFLKTPKKFQDLGARIPKGVLLVGPPGTGKTLFAKAVAGEANVPFFSISGSDFVEMFVGTGAARVRDLFDQAKRNMPCIIFIDEIDAVGRQRGAGMGGGHDEREQTLNQLLVQMDGFEQNDGIIIMAATNRADILDPALLRAGRFDRQVYVNVPDVKGREAIFRVHTRNKPIANDVSFKILARMTTGFSGADIENLLNEASILAVRAGRKVIIMEDVLEGINKVIAGPQKKSRVVTESDKRITAYHEAGHAIISKILEGCDEVQEVSIIPRGMAAGYTLTRPETDDSHMTKGKLNDLIAMMLGGRAAEQIVIHDISTGASNDIQRASGIARSMVTEWGMSEELGTIFLGGSHEVFLGKDYGSANAYSDAICGRVDVEVKKILDDNYLRALEIIKRYRTVMDSMVKVLYAKETIYTDEINMLFDGATSDEVCAIIDERLAKRESLRTSYKESQQPAAPVSGEVVASDIAVTETPVISDHGKKTNAETASEKVEIKKDADGLEPEPESQVDTTELNK